jgi:predicted Zn-dependent protease
MASEPDTDFVDKTTLRDVLDISDAAMDHAMGMAYQLYLAGRFAEAQTICTGLIACDHRYWWSYSLHASVLRRLGRADDALRAVEKGLQYEPHQPKLLLMRAELIAAGARETAPSPRCPGGMPQPTAASAHLSEPPLKAADQLSRAAQ